MDRPPPPAEATFDVTYSPTGGTLREPPTAPPGGFHRIDRRVPIGRGRGRFDEAAAAIDDWQVQRRSGVRVATDGPPTVGRRARLGVGIGPLRLPAPVVVIGVLDDPRSVEDGTPARKGFAYGTGKGHPESGEEAFLVEWDTDDVVWLRIIAFSRPATWFAKLGGPAGRAVQAFITNRYLRSLGSPRT